MKGEEKEKELAPTGMVYEQEQPLAKQEEVPIFEFQPMMPTFPLQPSFGFFEPPSKQKMSSKPTAEEWVECHRLFLQYLTKLRELQVREGLE